MVDGSLMNCVVFVMAQGPSRSPKMSPRPFVLFVSAVPVALVCAAFCSSRLCGPLFFLFVRPFVAFVCVAWP